MTPGWLAQGWIVPGWTVLGLAVLGVALSLPFWLPSVVVALRVRIFDRVNGDEGIPVPGRMVDTSAFKEVYASPAANGRSRGAALSDLFWYWLSPGAHVHQEHLEPGPRYQEVARCTRRILSGARKPEWNELVSRCTAHVLGEYEPDRIHHVRLRDLMMPVWAEVYHEIVFGERCPPRARRLIVRNADDVVSALKCTRLRHMDRRDELTRHVLTRIRAGTVAVALPTGLTEQEQAWYLQGTFFNTAVVQMSEAMAHLLLAIGTRPEVRARLETGDDPDYLDRVIEETLRVYPLFGIAHRVTSEEIVTGEVTLPSGSVLLFNYPAYTHAGGPDAARFDPDRWLASDAAATIRHLPFGVTSNRPCPARGIATITMRAAAEQTLRMFHPVSSVRHDRSMPNRGPALLVPPRSRADLGARLVWLRLRDRAEDVGRSLVQLVLGSYMVIDARRKALCRNYFAAQDQENPA